jgi:SET domain
MTSVAFQGLEEHEKMDSFLLGHLAAYLSTFSQPYDTERRQDAALFLSLLARPDDSPVPPIPKISPPPPPILISRLFERFGNNNFTVHSHLNSIAHGIFPLASRLFNHSCVPNAATKYILSHGKVPQLHIVALKDIEPKEEVRAAHTHARHF